MFYGKHTEDLKSGQVKNELIVKTKAIKVMDKKYTEKRVTLKKKCRAKYSVKRLNKLYESPAKILRYFCKIK